MDSYSSYSGQNDWKRTTVQEHVCALSPKNPVFRATRPYLSQPADHRLFFTKMPFFSIGVFLKLRFQFFKKTEPVLPNVFKTVALNTRFIFGLNTTHAINQSISNWDYILCFQILVVCYLSVYDHLSISQAIFPFIT